MHVRVEVVDQLRTDPGPGGDEPNRTKGGFRIATHDGDHRVPGVRGLLAAHGFGNRVRETVQRRLQLREEVAQVRAGLRAFIRRPPLSGVGEKELVARLDDVDAVLYFGLGVGHGLSGLCARRMEVRRAGRIAPGPSGHMRVEGQSSRFALGAGSAMAPEPPPSADFIAPSVTTHLAGSKCSR